MCTQCRAVARPAASAPPPHGVDCWSAPFAYEGAVRELVARAKYRGERHVLGWLADVAVAHRGEWDAAPVDAVTWVPTAAQRRRERGFDHGAILARRVARRLGVPLMGCLVRLDRGMQTARPLHERRSGPQLEAAGCPGVRMLVVDDVATTGASLTAAARVLRRSGSAAVEALTVARTPLPAMRR